LNTSFTNVTLENLDDTAQKIIASAGTQKLWCFYGEMGAGKTTLIKAICNLLLVTDEITSPTFSLVNEYSTADHYIIYHFDFYRIRTIEEVYDIGYEDYFYSGNICLIEWPENISSLLENEEVLRISIERIDENSRSITLSS
jgi:tRNA threonylcarbamoyladenosine biosynthesis protein TsaE